MTGNTLHMAGVLIRSSIFILLLCPILSHGQDKKVEYALKASWLTKFIKYMEWPQGSQGTELVIGILGEDPFEDIFAPVEGKPIMGRTLIISRFGRYHSDLELTKCDLLFIAQSEAEHVSTILAHIGQSPVLTVSEYRGFADDGGLINFLPMKRDHIRYEVNQKKAEVLGFRVTAPLLRYADRIISSSRRNRQRR